MSILALVCLLAAVQETAEPSRPPSEPAESATGPLVLVGGTVHSMVPGEAPRVANVWIENGRIRSIGDERPAGSTARVIDVHGKHVVPGLIDAHVNFDAEHDALYLAAGVTLVRDVGGDHAVLTPERAPRRRDRLPGPALLTAGAALDGDPPSTATAVILRSAHAAEDYLPILFEENVDFLCCLPGLPEDAWRRTLELAGERGLDVFGPRPPALDLAAAIAAGQDGFHALDSLLPPGVAWDYVQGPALDPGIVALVENRIPLVPLFEASALRLEDQEQVPESFQALALLAPPYESWWRAELAGRQPFLAPERRAAGERAVARQARALKACFDAGVRLVPGSGAPQPWLFPGLGLHAELERWVAVGVPPAAVFAMATRGAADALGQSGQRGTLEPGAWADVLVATGDPEEDLGKLLDLEWVVVRGQPVSRAARESALDALAETQAARRAALAAPLEIAPPPTPEEGVVVLEGTVETESFGTRLSAERYRVVRLPDGQIVYTGRIVTPRGAQEGLQEVTVVQRTRDGALEHVLVTLFNGSKVLEYEGLWTASTWRMQSRLDGASLGSTQPVSEHPVCCEVGSVTALLMLGQIELRDRAPVLQLHAGLDAELVAWRTQLDDNGDHQVRTQVGQRAFRLDPQGGLVFALNRIGNVVMRTRALSSEAFGGPGLPLPAAKRAVAASAPPSDESSAPDEDPGG
jgi:hypothetical protein